MGYRIIGCKLSGYTATGWPAVAAGWPGVESCLASWASGSSVRGGAVS